MRSLSVLAVLFLTLALAGPVGAQSRLWGNNGVALSTTGTVQFNGAFRTIVPDGSGGVYLVWPDSGSIAGYGVPLSGANAAVSSFCSGSPCPNANLYATHLDSNGSVATTWSNGVQHNGVLRITDRKLCP